MMNLWGLSKYKKAKFISDVIPYGNEIDVINPKGHIIATVPNTKEGKEKINAMGETFVKEYNEVDSKSVEFRRSLANTYFYTILISAAVVGILGTILLIPGMITYGAGLFGASLGLKAIASILKHNMKTMKTAEYYVQNKEAVNFFFKDEDGRKMVLTRKGPFKHLKQIANREPNVFDIINSSASIRELEMLKYFYENAKKNAKAMQEQSQQVETVEVKPEDITVEDKGTPRTKH
jgi:hypothetical protein